MTSSTALLRLAWSWLFVYLSSKPTVAKLTLSSRSNSLRSWLHWIYLLLIAVKETNTCLSWYFTYPWCECCNAAANMHGHSNSVYKDCVEWTGAHPSPPLEEIPSLHHHAQSWKKYSINHNRNESSRNMRTANKLLEWKVCRKLKTISEISSSPRPSNLSTHNIWAGVGTWPHKENNTSCDTNDVRPIKQKDQIVNRNYNNIKFPIVDLL